MYTIRLGGFGPRPTASPMPGYEWRPYLESGGTSQSTKCPSPAPFGCYMFNGYAWGQQPIVEGEFLPESAPGGSPQQQFCVTGYSKWAQANPDQARCLTAEDPGRYVAFCLAAVQDPSRAAAAADAWQQLVAMRCRSVEPAEPTPRQRCEQTFDNWVAYNPQQAACLRDDDRSRFTSWCVNLSPAEVTQRFNDLVRQRCQASAPPTPTPTPSPSPTPTPTPPPMMTPTPSPTPSPSPMPSPGPVPNGDTSQTPPIQKPSLLRQIGPVVGIGLLAAIALTLARK